jgi:hypothetical protein
MTKTILVIAAFFLSACGGAPAQSSGSPGEQSQAVTPSVSGSYALTMSSPIVNAFTAFSGTMVVTQSGNQLTATAAVSNPNLPDPSFSAQTVTLSGTVSDAGDVTLSGAGLAMQGKFSAADGSLSGGCTGLYAGAVWKATLR